MSRVTIKEVAQDAQVSTTTVSHVINNTRFVEPETRDRVMAAMQKLGYHPNSLARSLRSGVSKTIGLIVPDAANLFFAEVARKIEDDGYRQGYSVILCNSDNNPQKQTNYINTLLTKRVDGVIFISSGGRVEDLLKFSANQIPVVVADRDVPQELADIVLLDNEQAGFDATRHLIDLGHTVIACITGPDDLSPSMQREKGYRRALREAGIPYQQDQIIAGDFSFKSGEAAAQKLLSVKHRPTAIFALNDMMAIGAMTALRKAGLSVPEDVSIVGFDNIELASAVNPALTTIAQPIDEIARQATELLIHRLLGSRIGKNQRVILKAGLIRRESTAERKR